MEQKSYKNEIILELLKKNNHIREIAKSLNTNPMNISRKIRKLSSENVVDFIKEGKNKVYFLKRTGEVRINILIAENYKLLKTMSKHPTLRSIIEKIQHNKKIKMAILFGSYAKGRVKQDSDIDIYIETNDKNIKQKIEQIDSRLSIKIGKFDNKNLLIKELIKNHIILKGGEEFYEKTNFFN